LPQRRDRGGRVPFHANTLAVDRQRDRRRFQCGRGLTPRKNRGIRLTRRVRSQRRCLPWHDPRKSRPRNPGQLFQLLFLGLPLPTRRYFGLKYSSSIGQNYG
jgi:hypothetical protein